MTVSIPATKKTAISWSAGKDSCLALLRAREAGHDVQTFLTMCEADGFSKSHALAPEVVAAQVAAFGGVWRAVAVPEGVPGAYAMCFDAALQSLHDSGHTHVVFGDIDLQAHRDWLEPACERAGLQAVFPLWGLSRAALAREILDRGLRARLVCVDTGRLDARFCGRDYDAALLAELPAGVCVCGEDGEFHTVVVDAPGMAAPLALVSGGTRTVFARPPMRPTTLVFDELRLADAP
ncbi:adenosine nucleotide hydrolase [Sphaerotilus montanus]|uniref:Dph6-related ATP pyrophosphatase n=1 Tax=Sphaerotilus montanus TaxID=522889 RepID=UPI003FA308C6